MRLLLILSLSLFLSLSPKAQAHPHSWIDLETAPLFNKEGQITGLWVGWLFDDFYSAFSLEETKRNPDGTYNQADLDKLARTNLTNLSEYSYFTFAHVNGKEIPFLPVEIFKTNVQNNRLWMEFEVTFIEPIDPRTAQFDYAVYDPTYYVEILHAEAGEPVNLIGAEGINCGYTLNKPQPPEELSLMMADLDQTENAGTGVGIHFSEKVEISCGS